MAGVKEFLSNCVDEKAQYYIDISKEIWSWAERGYQENRSADLLCEALEKEEFSITRPLCGIPTAFKGVWGSGFPTIGFLGEYDALIGLSQKENCTQKQPLDGQQCGHGCGHNLLGVGSLAAAVALKDYLKEQNIPGTVVYFGCPAEEGGAGKVFMARDGAFDGVDFAFTWHPGQGNHVMNNHMVAIISRIYEFTGISSHAGSSPHLGRSALDSCELMNIGANYLREHIIPEARIQYAYRNAGGTATNVVPEYASVKYAVRAPYATQVREIVERLDQVAQGAALMSGTTVTMRTESAYSEFLQNPTIMRVMDEAFREIGTPPWDEADFEFARKIYATFNPMEKNAAESRIAMRYGKEAVAEKVANPLDTIVGKLTARTAPGGGCTDAGDVAHIVPTGKLNVATATLGTPLHSWQMTTQSNSPIGHKGMIVAAKVQALAAVKFFENHELIEEARRDMVKLYGDTYHCPIEDGIMPPDII